MIDADVNIDIDNDNSGFKYASMQQSDEYIDMKQITNDKGSTGNL